MTERPYVVLSAAQSLDGYLDDASETRLLLSNEDDFAEVDRLRAEADAILVGAGTVRADNPRLLVRSPELRRQRIAAGKPEQPIKVTITAGGELDPAARFFTTGNGPKLVYAPPGVAEALAAVATVVPSSPPEAGNALPDPAVGASVGPADQPGDVARSLASAGDESRSRGADLPGRGDRPDGRADDVPGADDQLDRGVDRVPGAEDQSGGTAVGAVGDDSHGGAVGVGAEAGDARRDAMAVTDSPPGGDSGDRGTGAGDGAREDGVDGSADTNGNGDSDGVGASGGTDHRGGTDVSSGTHYSAGADASQGTDYNDGTGASGDGGDSGGVDASGYGEGTGVIGGADHSGGTDYSGGTDASGGTDYNGGTGASGDSERVGASGGTDRSGGTDGTDGTDGAGGSGGTDGTDGAGGNGGAGGVVGGVQAGGRSGIAGRGGPRLEWVLDDLAARGVRTLLVEGGAAVHTQFLVAGLADELRLAVAPVVVGDSRAPRFLSDGAFPRPLELAEARRLGDVAVLRYRAAAEPSSQDVRWLRQAIELADRCPPSSTFRVGAVVGLPDGTVLATGHSGEGDPRNHAEEAALAKLSPDDPRLAEATIYSSLEPCSARASHPKSCTQLILETPIPRVVTAWREPVLFVDAEGVEQLTAAGRQVLEIPALAADVRRANTHLRGVRP